MASSVEVAPSPKSQSQEAGTPPADTSVKSTGSGESPPVTEAEKSAQRRTAPDQAYTGTHTDITLPYESIGSIAAVLEDGTRVEIIKDGRFVLSGTEELNRPLDSR